MKKNLLAILVTLTGLSAMSQNETQNQTMYFNNLQNSHLEKNDHDLMSDLEKELEFTQASTPVKSAYCTFQMNNQVQQGPEFLYASEERNIFATNIKVSDELSVDLSFPPFEMTARLISKDGRISVVKAKKTLWDKVFNPEKEELSLSLSSPSGIKYQLKCSPK